MSLSRRRVLSIVALVAVVGCDETMTVDPQPVLEAGTRRVTLDLGLGPLADGGAVDAGEGDGAAADDLGADDAGADDLGADDRGADDLGVDDLGADDLGADDLGVDDLGADDLGPSADEGMPDSDIDAAVMDRQNEG